MNILKSHKQLWLISLVMLFLACAVGTAHSSVLGCSDWLSIETSNGRLSNNVWNKQAANGFPYIQCLNTRTIDGKTQYGWSWSWPVNGTVVYAYPEIIVGAKPWEPGPGTDSRFPRKIGSTEHLFVSYDIETESAGSFNLATSLWIIDTPTVSDPPDTSAIQAELMIWTKSTPEHFSPGGTKRGEVLIDGYIWEVWAEEDWGDSSGQNPNTWTYITYRSKQSIFSITYDARKMIQDAINRGLLTTDLYLANVELGNEVMSGSGSTWLKTFLVSLTQPTITFPPPPPAIIGPVNLLLK